MEFKLGRSGPSTYDNKRLTLLDAPNLPTPPSNLAKARFNLIRNTFYPIMGNDKYGDCTVASAGHTIQAATTYEKNEFTPSTDQVVNEYFKLTGGPDQGLSLLDVLQPWRNTGLWGHKLAAYAEIPWTDTHLSAAQTRKLLRTSIWLSGSAYLALALPYGMQRNPYDWQTIGTGPDWRPGTWGGHAVPALLYSSGYKYWIVTWGKIVQVSEAFLRAYMDEAWVTVSNDWVNSKGKTPNGRSLSELARLATLI